MRLLVISFDAVSDSDLIAMSQRYDNIARFLGDSTLHTGVSSVFVTNTYPIHTSVATGVLPKEHGIRSNEEDGRWICDSRRIQAETIWEKATKKHLTTAAVLWPVTGYAKIKYNVPEMHVLPGENQILTNLRAGSTLFQLQEYLRHKKRLRGVSQPYLDDFVTCVSEDILRKNTVDLTLVHLTAYDDYCHRYGKENATQSQAADSLNRNLGRLLLAAGKDVLTIIFSDHGQLSVSSTIDPNELPFVQESNGTFELCGGSAFYRSNEGIQPDLLSRLQEQTWFERFVSDSEMETSGYAKQAAFGIIAKAGTAFTSTDKPNRGNHGYPVDYPDYQVFYAMNNTPGAPIRHSGGVITDVTQLIISQLKL
jgi:predicted AlkP superfamily pyrophosphatase or phosphodiesterase